MDFTACETHLLCNIYFVKKTVTMKVENSRLYVFHIVLYGADIGFR
jgi:hypothetical protein